MDKIYGLNINMTTSLNKGIDYIKDIINTWCGETIGKNKCNICTGNIKKCNNHQKYSYNKYGHIHMEDDNIYQCTGTRCKDCRIPICYDCAKQCHDCERFLCPLCVKYIYVEYDDNDISHTSFWSRCSRNCLYK